MKALDAWRVDRRMAIAYFLEQAKVMSALNHTNAAARTLLAVFCWPKTLSDLVSGRPFGGHASGVILAGRRVLFPAMLTSS
jgi:hypothetical protein